jgi:hypothetical protein
MPAVRLSARPGAEAAALAALVDGDPDELATLLEIRAMTDPAARAALEGLQAIGPAERYAGNGAGAVMLPFLIPRPSRFSSGRYGVLYGADHALTAIAEVTYHQTRRLQAAAAPSGTNVLLALWAFQYAAAVEDVRDRGESIHAADSYAAAQYLGSQLYADGSAGVLYRSVRHSDGECVGIFRPSVVTDMTKGDDWRLIWNGHEVSETLRVASSY